MKYIDAIKGSCIALVVFCVFSYFSKGYGPSTDIQVVFTVSSFFFAILSGFFISRFNARYDKIRELFAAEDSHFLSLYKVASFYGTNFLKRITDLIDNYYILSYDILATEGVTEYKYNAKYFLGIYVELGKLRPSHRREDASFGRMLDDLASIEDIRNTRSVLVLERVTHGQWAILLALSLIIILSVFYMRTTTIYSQVASVLLSTVVILVLLILRDLQNLRLNGQLPAIESGQEVFEDIGELRYYNKKYLDNGSIQVPKFVKTYRVGLHKPGEKPKIKVVSNN